MSCVEARVSRWVCSAPTIGSPEYIHAAFPTRCLQKAAPPRNLLRRLGVAPPDVIRLWIPRHHLSIVGAS